MKIKTSELIGKALDWAVAMVVSSDIKLSNENRISATFNGCCYPGCWEPSTYWEQCGQLIDEYSIDLSCEIETTGTTWSAREYYYSGWWSEGETPQIAICRAVVSSKLGDEVEIPSELMEKNNDQ